MKALDPISILGTLRQGGAPDYAVLAVPTVGLAEAVLLCANVLERGPPAMGFLGLHPGYNWFPTPNLADVSSVVRAVAAQLFEVAGASLSIQPSTDPHDPWIAIVLESRDASSADEREVRRDLDDAIPGTSDVSAGNIEGTAAQYLHAGLLERAGLVGVPSLMAHGVIDAQGQMSLAGVLCLVRGVQPPCPGSWQIVIGWFEADPETVRARSMAPVRSRAWSPPLPIAIEAILDELSVGRPFRGRHGGHARAALREILVNAVAHRSYERQLQEPIRIGVYPDRVVAQSPGVWMGPGEAGGDPRDEVWPSVRNPHLHALLAALGLCGQQGLGLDRARMFAHAVGMRLELDIAGPDVTASLVVDRQRSLELDAPGSRGGPVLKAGARVREERVLEFLRRRDSASKREIVEALGIAAASVAQTLGVLVGRGEVMRMDRSPRSPRQRYRIAG